MQLLYLLLLGGHQKTVNVTKDALIVLMIWQSLDIQVIDVFIVSCFICYWKLEHHYIQSLTTQFLK